MTTKTLKTSAGSVVYRESGKGTAILYIHGGHGSCREDFLLKGLDLSSFRVIQPSRPGYGETPLTESHSPKNTAALFVSLLDELAIKKVIVIAASAGGPAAIELAAAYPERVMRLALVSAITRRWMRPSNPVYRKAKILFAPSVERYSWSAFRMLFKFMPGAMARLMFNEVSMFRPATFSKAEIEELRKMTSIQRSWKGFVADLNLTVKSETLSAIQCPTLIMHSHFDRAVPKEHAQHAYRMIEEATLLRYPNRWGHLLWIGSESAKLFGDLQNFLNHTSAEIRTRPDAVRYNSTANT